MDIAIGLVSLAILLVTGLLVAAFTAPMVSKTLRHVPTERWADLTQQVNEALRPTPESARKNDFDFVSKPIVSIPNVPGSRFASLFHDDPTAQLQAALDQYQKTPDDLNRVFLVEAVNQVIGHETVAPDAAELADRALAAIHATARKVEDQPDSEGDVS